MCGWVGSTQEKVEITKEQQVLMKVITDAYNKHQIPQDVAKKLVRDRLMVFSEVEFIGSDSKKIAFQLQNQYSTEENFLLLTEMATSQVQVLVEFTKNIPGIYLFFFYLFILFSERHI